MIELLCNDLGILERWKDILKEYAPKEIEAITLEEDKKIIIADMPSSAKSVLDFLKLTPKHNIDFILLESVPDTKTAKKVLALGAKAYGNSYMLPVHLISCVETVKSGHIWVYPEFTYSLIEDIFENSEENSIAKERKLTKREQQIANEVINGLNNQQIADKLNISQQTVKVHLSNIFQKLHISNRVELALYFTSSKN